LQDAKKKIKETNKYDATVIDLIFSMLTFEKQKRNLIREIRLALTTKSIFYEYIPHEQIMENPEIKLQTPKKELSLIFIGKTGEGKTTAINFITNYMFNKRFEDDHLVLIPQNGRPSHFQNYLEKAEVENVLSFESQTVKPTTYLINPPMKNGLHTVFLTDNPGLKDTGGSGKDKKNSHKILKEINKRGYFNAIIWVMAPTTRFTKEIEEMCIGIKQLLTKGSEKHLIFLITRSINKVPQETAGIIRMKMGFSTNKIFNFDFECLYSNDAKEEINDQKNAEEMEVFQTHWQKNFKNMTEMFNDIGKLPVHQTEDFEKLRKKRNELFKEIKICEDEMFNLFVSFSNQTGYIRELELVSGNIESTTNFQRTEIVPDGKINKNVFSCRDCSKYCFADDDAIDEKEMKKEILTKKGFWRKSICKICDHSWQHHERKVLEQMKMKKVTIVDEKLKSMFQNSSKKKQEMDKLLKEGKQNLTNNKKKIQNLFKNLGEKYCELNVIAFEPYDPTSEIRLLKEKFQMYGMDNNVKESLETFIQELEKATLDMILNKKK